jgi:hypothetical protein
MADNSLPRDQLRLLTKHFFGRFFDSEVFASLHSDMHLLYVQALALIVLPGVFKTFLMLDKYSWLAWQPLALRDQVALIDRYFFISLSMILIGFITVFEWDSLFPDQKDFYNLTPLPIQPRIIFFAKVSALSLFIAFFHIAFNLVPTLLFPAIVLTPSSRIGSAGMTVTDAQGPLYLGVHIFSLFLSSLFVFTSLIAIRAICLLIIPARLMRMVSRCIQLALMIMLFFSLFSFLSIRADLLVKEGSRLIYFLPSFWFLGIYETLIGHHSLALNTLARMAYIAVAISFILSILSYMVSYRSSMQKGFQSAGNASYSFIIIKKTWNWILHKILLRDAVERAAFHFIAKTAFCRQQNLLYWGSFIAVGIALNFLGFFSIKSVPSYFSSQDFPWLCSMPLIMSFFILVGLRFTFSVPADLNANWLFKMIDKPTLAPAFRGVHKFMACSVIIPILILYIPGYLMIWSPQRALKHIAYVSLLSLMLIELLLIKFEKLPFTCSYIPGKANIKAWWPVYLLAFSFYCFGTAAIEQILLNYPIPYTIFMLIAVALLIGLNWYRSFCLKRISSIRFEEEMADRIVLLSDQDLGT